MRSTCSSSEAKDVRARPLLERKELLGQVLAGGKVVIATGFVISLGLPLFEAADQSGLEGIVAKRGDSPCRGGRSLDWIKIKTAHGRAIDDERAKWNG